MCKLILNVAWVFTDRFCRHFNTHGFTNHSKNWIQLRNNNVHYHLVSQVQKAATCNLLSKLPWKRCDFPVFATIVRRKTSSPERFLITFLVSVNLQMLFASTDNFAGPPERSRSATKPEICSFWMTRETLERLASKPPLFDDLNIAAGWGAAISWELGISSHNLYHSC